MPSFDYTCEHPDRVLLLAELLEQRVKPDDFEMDTWVWPDKDDVDTLDWQDAAERWTPEKCGTAGCAIGHACEMPEFKALGLVKDPLNGAPKFQPTDAYGFSAIQDLFGMSHGDASALFTPPLYQWIDQNITPAVVSKGLREYALKCKEIANAKDQANRTDQATAVLSS